MIKLTFPDYNFKTKKKDHKELIFDPFRKKWVTLTPEEWVRQNMLQFIAGKMGYPKSHIAIEKKIKLFDTEKRFDIVVYNGNMEPHILIECKSMNEDLNGSVLDQALRYSMSIPALYIVITNGVYCYAFMRGTKELVPLTEFPHLFTLLS
jgi:hypothetical protein